MISQPEVSAYVCFLGLERLPYSAGLSIVSGPLRAFSEPPTTLAHGQAVQDVPPVCSCAPHTYRTGLHSLSECLTQGLCLSCSCLAAPGTAGKGILQHSLLLLTNSYTGLLLPLILRSSQSAQGVD